METDGDYRLFVTRKKIEDLGKAALADIRDEQVGEIVRKWVESRGGDPKKAVPPYPKRGRKGPEIRKVRVLKKQKIGLMAKVATGYTDLGNNHHIAIFRLPNGKTEFEVVSLFEASRRMAKGEPAVRRARGDGATFVMSLSQGDALRFPDSDPGVKIIESVWASGVIVVVDHIDATGATRFRPTAGAVVKRGARKLSVDPIGRVRLAND